MSCMAVEVGGGDPPGEVGVLEEGDAMAQEEEEVVAEQDGEVGDVEEGAGDSGEADEESEEHAAHAAEDPSSLLSSPKSVY